MFLFFSEQLTDFFSAFNAFTYITTRGILSALSALVISFVFGPKLIRALSNNKIGEKIRSDGPSTHSSKSGTPTMGGLIILLSITVSTLIWSDLSNPYILNILISTLLFGLIGFIDDLSKLKGNPNGMKPSVKISLQILIASSSVYFLNFYSGTEINTELLIPFTNNFNIDLGVLFFPFIVFVIVGASNAVNLTDGLDGLAIMPVSMIAIALGVFAYVTGNINFANYLDLPFLNDSGEVFVICCAIAGSGLGFLWFNTYPAEVFMGDVEKKTKKDLDKLGMALAKLAEEDPTFKVKYDEETNQTVISGMGELHLEIIVDRLRREFGVECNQGAPQVNYREALQASTSHRERLKKQSGGSGLFADMEFELGPADEEFLESEDFKNGKVRLQFEWGITGGSIDKNYQKPIRDGFTSMMDNGILAGYSINAMKVRVFDGSMHAVDSKPIAFELCAKEGFKSAAKKCKPTLLEPIMKLEVTTPEDYVGSVIGDLNRRRGLPKGQEARAGGAVAIQADVPLSEMFGYVTSLRTITSGRASSTMEFSHYASPPRSIADDVIAKSKGEINV